MNPGRNRHVRENESSTAPKLERRPGRRLRWAALLAMAAVAIGVIPAAQASTGGAAAEPAPAPVPTAPEGEEIAFSPMRTGGASWYGGPGMWGRKTACGQTLQPDTLGVAHRKLPCGTTVKFVYHGHSLITQVIDRGPYVQGRTWDLTSAASEALGLEGVGQVHYAVALETARPGTTG